MGGFLFAIALTVYVLGFFYGLDTGKSVVNALSFLGQDQAQSFSYRAAGVIWGASFLIGSQFLALSYLAYFVHDNRNARKQESVMRNVDR